MASTQLSTDTRNKLMKIIPMLGSDNDGQIVAAATALKRVLEANGKDLIDLSKALTKKPKESVAQPTTDMKDRAIINLYKENKSLKIEIEKLKTQVKELKASSLMPSALRFSPSFFWCLFFFVLWALK